MGYILKGIHYKSTLALFLSDEGERNTVSNSKTNKTTDEPQHHMWELFISGLVSLLGVLLSLDENIMLLMFFKGNCFENLA